VNRRLWLPLVVALLAACATVPPKAAAPVHVTIIGTTDIHGFFNGQVLAPPGGGEGVHIGGLAILSAYVTALRAENPGRVLLVDSGDLFQGTLESNLFEGEPVVRGYNALGYTAAAIGNHEFDYGPLGPDTVPHRPGQDPFGALERNVQLANFPFLSANIVDKTTGRAPAWARPSMMVGVGGVKIGIIGLSTVDTPNTTMILNVETLQFTDPVEATLREAKALRERGADAIVVIAHMGGKCADVSNPNDASSCNEQQEGMHYLRALPHGAIDAFFAGHSHNQMRQWINGIPALEAPNFSVEFSTLDLYVDPAAHRVLTDKTTLRPNTMLCPAVYAGTEQCDPRRAPAGAKLVPRVFDGVTIQPDARVQSVIEPFLARTAAKRGEKTGIVTTAVFPEHTTTESPLGDLLTDALREWAHSDIAFINSGGIRTALAQGEVTYGDVFVVTPFDNYASVVEMTGAQVEEALQLTSTGERGILQVSGLRYSIDYTLDAGKPQPQQRHVVSVTLADGAPLDPAKTYRVAMPDFLAAGGDGMLPVTSAIPAARITTNYERTLRDLFIDVIRRHPQPIAPKTDGRISVVKVPSKSPAD
jgi:5'-nucleotidase